MAQYLDVTASPYLAAGNGTTDDTTAIQDAIDDAVGHGLGEYVYFPQGTYKVSSLSLNDASHLVLRGAGREISVILGNGLSANVFTATSGSARNVTIQDLGITSSSNSTYGIDLQGQDFSDALRVERCRFYNMHGVRLVGLVNVRIADSLFHGAGRNLTDAITLGDVFSSPATGGGTQIVIEGNELRYVRNGIQLHTPNVSGNFILHNYESIRISDNYFDLGWFTQVETIAGSGGTVTYTGTTLTDSAATFTGISDTYVRALPVIDTGTATYNGVRLTDGTAQFLSGAVPVSRGDIVKSGSAWALVDSVESDTVLYVDEWLSNTDRTPVAPPAANASYTVYKLVLGRVTASSTNSLTVVRWMTLNGVTLPSAPAAGTRYELSTNVGNHPILVGPSVHSATISRNRFRRGYADQIGMDGYHCLVSDNTIEDGQDMGITIEDGHTNVISNNVIRGQGANCIIVIDSSDNVVSGNVCVDAYRIPGADADRAAGICVDNASRNLISGNHLERLTTSPMQLGVTVLGASDSTVVSLNTFRDAGGATAARYRAAGTSNNTQFLDNTGGTAATAGSATLVTMRVSPPPRAIAYNSTAQSIPRNAWTTLTFDTELEDLGGMHNTASNTERFTCPAGADGLYLVIGQLMLEYDAQGQRQFQIRKNGGATFAGYTITSPLNPFTRMQVSALVPMVANDYVDFAVLHDASVNDLDAIGGAVYNTFGSIAKIA
jgi:parallel beta-helix repeat protein